MRKILIPMLMLMLGAWPTPSYLGSVVVAAPYGTSVAVLLQQGDWIKVRVAEGQAGWMHQSALTKKRIVMSAGGATAQAGASSEELALAGKGFNSDVEKEFKSQNPNLNFAAVDRMIKTKVSADEMRIFLKAGAVQPAEGGAR
ncbi:MAG: SH3 domain-containing protein [Kiritimatiellaeota bacterium]|nr:SH3 domain-containing protein [Kiritimatiellota bacterium]